jgi:hypothetical protein
MTKDFGSQLEDLGNQLAKPGSAISLSKVLIGALEETQRGNH